MNELVRLTTQDVNNATMVCSTRDVAEKFGKRHYDILTRLEGKARTEWSDYGLIEEIESTGNPVHLYFIKNEYFDSKNRAQKEYLLTRDGFSLLVMGFTGKEALEWKMKYIKAFNMMENELKARQETRHIGIAIRKDLTETIKNKVSDEGNFKKFAYGNYSKLVYKKVLGTTVKKAKEDRGLKDTDNIRNFLTIQELEQVQALESKIAFYIEMRTDISQNDKEVYAEVKKYIDSLI